MSAKRARRGKGSVSRSGDGVHGTADGDSCEPGYVADCSGDGDCCSESRIGDELCDGKDQEYGCDLSCYANELQDCGACAEAMACSACGDGCAWCAADLICAPADNLPTQSDLWDQGHTAVTCHDDDYVETCPARDDPVPDPYYEAQWYLEAIRAPEAWAAGYNGSGVQILINDEGVDNTHPDLAKLDVANSCDVYAPSGGDAHGTVCASLAAGDSNSHCGVGAAPNASLASCVLFSSSGGPVASQAYGEDYLAWAYDVNDISSNSWGIDHCWRTAYSADCPFACPSGTSSSKKSAQ